MRFGSCPRFGTRWCRKQVGSLTQRTLGPVEEEVEYGGILFSSGGVQVGRVFAYVEHLLIEFSKGASIQDPFGSLEGPLVTIKLARREPATSPDTKAELIASVTALLAQTLNKRPELRGRSAGCNRR